jgi:hypothetical protein
LLLLAVLALAGCGGGGGGKSPAESMADCLNGQGYDVAASGDTVTGSSPGGVDFTATLKDDKLTIDDSGIGPGVGLSDQERTTVELCTDERFKSRSG